MRVKMAFPIPSGSFRICQSWECLGGGWNICNDGVSAVDGSNPNALCGVSDSEQGLLVKPALCTLLLLFGCYQLVPGK